MSDRQARPGYLLLEDGRRFDGTYMGPETETAGEAVFTTVMTGYHEVLTDPSFAAQIVVMTAPMQGVYGIRDPDVQSRRPWVAGFIVRHLSREVGSGPADATLPEYLASHGIPTLIGADTRALTRHIRDAGAMRAVLAHDGIEPGRAAERLAAEPEMSGRDLATAVSTPEPYELDPSPDVEVRGLVLCLDYGVKTRSLDLFLREGYRVRVVPCETGVNELLDARPNGVFLSNGPGDPEAVPGAVDRIRALSDAGIPLFGICLGHQLIARAFGARNYKLPYGHRGGNHPVLNYATGAVEITSQNHGFAVLEKDGRIEGADGLEVTHRNLNDGTVEGLVHRERPVFAVQYHPESAPGPHDSRYLFTRFVETMRERTVATTR
ncbi:glutamine-hydrolyzing carbamoyl-phosphate synthase small subunit [Candidatus Palauibacter sp.]|uniref:glutamine-hydrolyzing carbamoyl-phosphate synthase small subunit n=1 Tax=Candidatus Palauibacter sp. TaxID=3101350 RepID=UPI003B5302CD